MSVHPDKTAWRAIDALGGAYSSDEVSSGFAMGHGLAIAEAMEAVYAADTLTSELLDQLCAARDFIDGFADVRDGNYGDPEPNAAMQLVTNIDAVINKAEGL